MAYPATPLPIKAELQTSDGDWHDVTTDVIRDGLQITRGRADEAVQSDAGRCVGTLDNRDGNYSPRLPTGDYYGLIGRNTPFRVSLTTQGDHYITLDDPSTQSISAPDSASLSVTGDLEVICDVDFDDWTDFHRIMQKWTTTGNQRSWVLEVYFGGYLRFWYSTDGTAETMSEATVPLPFTTGRYSIKVTMDVNNGAGGHTVTFYYSDSYSGSYTQLGDPVINSGTSNTFDSTASTFLWSSTGAASYYRGTIKNGIAGSVVGDCNIASATAGVTSFSDGTNTWTSHVAVSDRDWRYHGEISAWPTRWDKSNNDRYVPFVSDGILRRILKGDPVQSTIYRAMSSLDNSVAYWPMEDGADSTEFAPGPVALVAGVPMTVTGTDPEFAAYDGFNGSLPIPTLDNLTILRGTVKSHASSGFSQVRGLIKMPEAGALADNTEIISLNHTGTAAGWQVRYFTTGNGSLTIRSFDADGGSLVNDGPWGFEVDGKELLLSIELTQNGSNIDWDVATWEVDTNTEGLVASGTLNSRTIGRLTRVEWNTNGGTPGMSVGHTVAQNEVTGLFERGDEVRAWIGESAAERIQRLCEENGIECRVEGEPNDSPQMGPQLPMKLIDLLREAAECDGGVLYEARDFLGLRFRTRASMWAQPAAATLEYNTFGLQDLVPVEDDQLIWNDIIVTRKNGGSFRAEETEGELAVTGMVGRNTLPLTLNVRNNLQLPDEAYWRLHVNTYPGARFPIVDIDMGNPDVYGSAVLWATLSNLDCGQRVIITDPPPENLPPDDIDLLIQGTNEFLRNFERRISFNTSPGEPWRIGVIDDADELVGYESRYDTDGSETATPLAAYQVAFAGSQTRTYQDVALGTDLDVKVLVTATDWTPASEQIFAAKYNNTGNQRTWAFGMASGSSGSLTFYWSTDGSSNTQVSSSVGTGFTDGTKHWVRVTLDVSNGSSVRELRFWTSSDGVTWTQLGTTSLGGAATSLFDSTALFQLGARSGTALTSSFSGSIHGVHVQGTIADTMNAADNLVPFDPNDWTDGYTGSGTGSVLSAQTSSIIAVDQSADADTAGKPLWTTDGGEVPLDVMVGGERWTVTAISGTTAPQLFTVTRSVNGVVKSHSEGADVRLADPVYYGVSNYGE